MINQIGSDRGTCNAGCGKIERLGLVDMSTLIEKTRLLVR